MSNQVRLRKIPLEEFIDVLLDLHNSGVCYIDIIGNVGEKIDKVGIFVEEQYMKHSEKVNGNAPVILKRKNLTDEDINQLLNLYE